MEKAEEMEQCPGQRDKPRTVLFTPDGLRIWVQVSLVTLGQERNVGENLLKRKLVMLEDVTEQLLEMVQVLEGRQSTLVMEHGASIKRMQWP